MKRRETIEGSNGEIGNGFQQIRHHITGLYTLSVASEVGTISSVSISIDFFLPNKKYVPSLPVSIDSRLFTTDLVFARIERNLYRIIKFMIPRAVWFREQLVPTAESCFNLWFMPQRAYFQAIVI